MYQYLAGMVRCGVYTAKTPYFSTIYTIRLDTLKNIQMRVDQILPRHSYDVDSGSVTSPTEPKIVIMLYNIKKVHNTEWLNS